MGLLQFDQRLTRQPQGLVGVDWRNSLCDRITHLIPFGGQMRDIVGGSRLTLASGGSIAADSMGLSLRGSGSAAVASMPLNLSAYTKATISFWLYWDAFANDNDLALELTSGGGVAGQLTVGPNTSIGRFQVAMASGPSNYKAASFTRPAAGVWNHYYFTLDRTGGAGVLGITSYVNGSVVSQTSDFTQTLSGTAFANSTLYVLSRNNASLFGAGRIQNLVIRGGHLGSELEAHLEYKNPWQLFAPRRIWVPVSAASGPPTLAAIAASNLTASGARLTVTV